MRSRIDTRTRSGCERAESYAPIGAMRRFQSEILTLWPSVLEARSDRVPGLPEAVGRLKLAVRAWAGERALECQGHLNRWELMIDEPTLRAGVLRMRGGNRFPLHDHPESLSVSLVISGSVIAGGFGRPTGSGTGRTVQLVAVGRRLLRAGEISLVLPEHGNAHDLSALTDTVLLEVTVSRNLRGSRFWYFPLARRADRNSHLAAIALRQNAAAGG